MRAGVDYTTLTPARRLRMLAALHEWRHELDAMQAEVLAAIAAEDAAGIDRSRDPGKQWAREDVACALRVPGATAAGMLETAHELITRFPDTLHAMWEGQISARMAERLVDATTDLPESAAREVEARVLTHAGMQTFPQFAHAVRRAVAAVDPRAAEDKHAAARDERRVVFTALEHGMSELFAVLPADHAADLRAAVETLADSWTGLDERTADQRRADALHHLALQGAGDNTAAEPRSPRAVINVSVALSTLLCLDDRPGELDQHGPIPATVARRLAHGPNTVWRRLLTDPQGRITDISANTYRPPAAMTRYVQLRDRTCRFPGCQRRASRCELDHLKPWLRSRDTSPGNLLCLCSRHHHLKHEAGWEVRRDPDHTVRWTNPAKQTYTRPPPEPPPY